MSGVIDEKGQQWEHCTLCGMSHKIQNLGYLPKAKKYPHGLDIGLCCINKLTQSEMRKVVPAHDWKAVYN